MRPWALGSILLASLAVLPAPAPAALMLLRTYDGTSPGGGFGSAAIVVGDMDGDGAAEYAIGAPNDAAGGPGAGRVFVYRGSDVLPNNPTWVITGEPGEHLGHALAVGYVDGDFVPDLIIGAPGSIASPGRVVIAYGGNPLGARQLRSTYGEPGFGSAVAGAWSGAAAMRVLIGSPEAHASAGEVHAFGGGDPLPGAPMFVLHGRAPGERFGAAISDAGITRGFVSGAEFLVGAPGPEGGGWPGRAALYLHDAPNDTVPDVEIIGTGSERLGHSISGGLDINPNFFEPSDDYVIGAPGASPGVLPGAGSAYVMTDDYPPFSFHGTTSGAAYGSTVRLMDDVTGSYLPDLAIASSAGVHLYPGALRPGATPRVTLFPENATDGFGKTISNSGAMNDAIARYQFMVGAPQYGGSLGRVYVYFDPTAATDVTTPALGEGVHFGPAVPNPSRGAVQLSVDLPRAALARIAVLDLAGREVATLHHGPLDAGRSVFEWNPRESCAPGLYWGVLETDGRRVARRMVRMR